MSLGCRIAGLLRPGDAVLLHGPLGAGKSVLARAILRTMAADPSLEVPSPSFTLVQSYDMPHVALHHYDLWRLAGPDELLELGWDESRAGIVLVEWPERLGALTPPDALVTRLAPQPGHPDRRLARLSGWEGRPGAAALVVAS